MSKIRLGTVLIALGAAGLVSIAAVASVVTKAGLGQGAPYGGSGWMLPMHQWMHGGAAPSPPPQPVPGSSEINVTLVEFSFSPDRVEVESGSDVAVVLQNKGRLPHDFTIDEIGLSIPVMAGSTVKAGIRVPRSQAMEFYCSIPGHRSAGMRGVLVAS